MLDGERDAQMIAWLNPRGGKSPAQILNRVTLASLRTAQYERWLEKRRGV